MRRICLPDLENAFLSVLGARTDITDGIYTVPPDDEPYDFIFIGDAEGTQDDTKTTLSESVSATFHVYVLADNAVKVTVLMASILDAFSRELVLENGFRVWNVDLDRWERRKEVSDRGNVQHGIITLKFDVEDTGR